MNKKLRYLARRLRDARGSISQKQAAAACGLSQSVISKVESGAREPTALELMRFAEFYNRPLSYFFLSREELPSFVTEDDVSAMVEKYGYRLLVYRRPPRPKTEISCEDTIMAILGHFSDPRLLEAVPVLIYYNDVDYDELYNRAWRENLQNRLGYMAGVTIICFKGSKSIKQTEDLKNLMERLERVKLAREDAFCEKVDQLSERMLSFLRETREPLAAEWNILDRLYTESFKEVFKHAILAEAA